MTTTADNDDFIPPTPEPQEGTRKVARDTCHTDTFAPFPTELSRAELVVEAFHTFGEEAARPLADHLAIPFEHCRIDIERLARHAA